MTIVKEECVLVLVAVNLVGLGEEKFHQGCGRGAGDEGGFTGKLVEQHEAERFAGLRFGRADVEVNGGTKNFEAAGICGPEGEDSELVLVAGQVSADVGGEGIEELWGSGLRRCGFFRGLAAGGGGWRFGFLRWHSGLGSGLLFVTGQHFGQIVVVKRVHIQFSKDRDLTPSRHSGRDKIRVARVGVCCQEILMFIYVVEEVG